MRNDSDSDGEDNSPRKKKVEKTPQQIMQMIADRIDLNATTFNLEVALAAYPELFAEMLTKEPKLTDLIDPILKKLKLCEQLTRIEFSFPEHVKGGQYKQSVVTKIINSMVSRKNSKIRPTVAIRGLLLPSCILNMIAKKIDHSDGINFALELCDINNTPNLKDHTHNALNTIKEALKKKDPLKGADFGYSFHSNRSHSALPFSSSTSSSSARQNSSATEQKFSSSSSMHDESSSFDADSSRGSSVIDLTGPDTLPSFSGLVSSSRPLSRPSTNNSSRSRKSTRPGYGFSAYPQSAESGTFQNATSSSNFLPFAFTSSSSFSISAPSMSTTTASQKFYNSANFSSSEEMPFAVSDSSSTSPISSVSSSHSLSASLNNPSSFSLLSSSNTQLSNAQAPLRMHPSRISRNNELSRRKSDSSGHLYSLLFRDPNKIRLKRIKNEGYTHPPLPKPKLGIHPISRADRTNACRAIRGDSILDEDCIDISSKISQYFTDGKVREKSSEPFVLRNSDLLVFPTCNNIEITDKTTGVKSIISVVTDVKLKQEKNSRTMLLPPQESKEISPSGEMRDVIDPDRTQYHKANYAEVSEKLKAIAKANGGTAFGRLGVYRVVDPNTIGSSDSSVIKISGHEVAWYATSYDESNSEIELVYYDMQAIRGGHEVAGMNSEFSDIAVEYKFANENNPRGEWEWGPWVFFYVDGPKPAPSQIPTREQHRDMTIAMGGMNLGPKP